MRFIKEAEVWKSSLTAMKTQHILMYGLSRSPTLAHFQKMPANLVER